MERRKKRNNLLRLNKLQPNSVQHSYHVTYYTNPGKHRNHEQVPWANKETTDKEQIATGINRYIVISFERKKF